METSGVMLTIGAVISGLIALLHGVLAIRPGLWRYVAPGGTSAVREMAIQGSTGTMMATVALAVMFAVWTLYALSGAGAIGRLPLLRTGLIGIGVIFLLRALFIVPEARMVLVEGYSVRFVLFSGISLVAGVLYLVGAFMLRQPTAA